MMSVRSVLKITIIVCIVNGKAFGQKSLPIIVATCGKGQNVDWPKIEKEENNQEGGPGFFYQDCSQGTTPIAASSTLKSQGGKNYGINNLNDSNPMTAWVEGKPGYGIGESFTVKALNVNTIYNGYQSTPVNWKNNSRVKKFKVYINNTPLCYLILTDEMGEQQFTLPYQADYEKTADFKFEIVEVYKGLKWDDVAISHIDNNGCCFASETAIGLFNNTSQHVSDLSVKETILGLNLTTGLPYSMRIGYVTQQIHASILEVTTTGNHTIRITADHPLYTKQYGFISLNRLRAMRNLPNVESLANTIEVSLWNEETKALYDETIIRIQSVTGQFKTYTLKGLPPQSAYVANGFITTTY